MRRLLSGVAVVLLLAPTLAAMATGYNADYFDGFHDGNYSGNIGSLDYSGPWEEFGDPQGGGASGGWVHVDEQNCSSNDCLHIEGEGLFVASFGAKRAADLGAFESATLSYDIKVIPIGLTTTKLQVQVYNGTRWVTVKEYDLSVETAHHKEIAINEYVNKGFAVRFIVPNVVEGELLELGVLFDGWVAIDNVRIAGYVPGQTGSTTSTTAPMTTSKPSETTSTVPKTTTTSEPVTSPSATSTPTSTAPSTTTSVERVATGNDSGETTSTTVSTTTSTTRAGGVLVPREGPPPGSGLRRPSVGVMADYKAGMMGDMGEQGPEVLRTEIQADFSVVVEAFGEARIWIAALAFLIAAAVVSGMDWRRSKTEVV